MLKKQTKKNPVRNLVETTTEHMQVSKQQNAMTQLVELNGFVKGLSP